MNNNNQQGFILPIVLVMLLMLTLLGVSSMNSSTVESRIAGNVQNKNTVFHAADSYMQSIFLSQGTGPLAINFGDTSTQLFPVPPATTVTRADHTNNLTVEVSAVVTFVVPPEGGYGCPATAGAESSFGKVRCNYWSINSTATHANSSSSSTIEQGLYTFAPNQQ